MSNTNPVVDALKSASVAVTKADGQINDALAVALPGVQIGKINLAKLGGDLADVIEGQLSSLIKGAQSDLKMYANSMANDAIRVMNITDDARRNALLEELAQQVKLVGEIHRLQATQAEWTAAGQIFKTVVATAVKLIVP